jgi:hypothetical protein
MSSTGTQAASLQVIHVADLPVLWWRNLEKMSVDEPFSASFQRALWLICDEDFPKIFAEEALYSFVTVFIFSENIP